MLLFCTGRNLAMKKIGIILVVFIAFIAYDIYNIPLPEEATDTFTTRIFMFMFKIANLKVCVADRAKYLCYVSPI